MFMWLCLYQMNTISPKGRLVPGHKAPSTRLSIYEFLYNINTVLYHFFETGTSARTNIGRNQLLKCLGFSLYPLSIYLNSPFK